MYVRVKRELVIGGYKVCQTKSDLYFVVVAGFCSKLFSSLDELIAAYPRCEEARFRFD